MWGEQEKIKFHFFSHFNLSSECLNNSNKKTKYSAHWLTEQEKKTFILNKIIKSLSVILKNKTAKIYI